MKGWTDLSSGQQSEAMTLLKILGAVVVVGLIYLAVRAIF